MSWLYDAIDATGTESGFRDDLAELMHRDDPDMGGRVRATAQQRLYAMPLDELEAYAVTVRGDVFEYLNVVLPVLVARWPDA